MTPLQGKVEVASVHTASPDGESMKLQMGANRKKFKGSTSDPRPYAFQQGLECDDP